MFIFLYFVFLATCLGVNSHIRDVDLEICELVLKKWPTKW